MKKKKLHLLIGVTLYNVMPVETFMSLNNLLFELLRLIGQEIGNYKNFSFSFCNTKGMVTDQARNNIVSRLLHDKEATHLFFIDSDMVLPANVFPRLLALNADIATAIAFKKWYPHQPTIYKFKRGRWYSLIDYPENKIIKIDGCGMACCLIKKEVFKKIKEPWFEFKPYEINGKKVILSEDLVFCEKVKKAGFTIKCDTGLVCGHVGGIIDNRTYQGVKKLSPIHNLPFHIPGLSRRKKK